MNKNIVEQQLEQAVHDYLLWMAQAEYSQGTMDFHKRILTRFQSYISSREMRWDAVFTHVTLTEFGKHCHLSEYRTPVRGLARYLFKNNRISKSLDTKDVRLPALYMTYLDTLQKTKQVSEVQVLPTRRVLVLFEDWLASNHLELADINIRQLDSFQAEVSNKYTASTRTHHRSALRGFMNWLFYKKIIRRNLAPFIVGAPQYAQAKPPRFLRPDEVNRLFTLSPESDNEKRTWVMLHLACFLGLRPKEISLITLDDIRFSRQEITLPQRKGANPIIIPLPMAVLKVMAEYIMETRAKSTSRAVFLEVRAPYKQVSPFEVSRNITAWMRKAGVPGSAYWLRHTYAQNLLESGSTLFEIKEMLGHDSVETTSIYLRIDHKMMRKALFNETI